MGKGMNGELAAVHDDWEGSGLEDETSSEKWQLKKLKPLHKQVASLVAQGLKNVEVAKIVGITPEYVSMLLGQPLVKEYVAEMCGAVGVRMEALFEKSVDVIAETLDKGSEGGKLKAARLQLEATKRIGRPDPMSGLERGTGDRLALLAERLLALQTNVRQGRTFNEQGQEITDVG